MASTQNIPQDTVPLHITVTEKRSLSVHSLVLSLDSLINTHHNLSEDVKHQLQMFKAAMQQEEKQGWTKAKPKGKKE